MNKEEHEDRVRKAGEGGTEDENIKLMGFGFFSLWYRLKKHGLFPLKGKY
jgi:nucleoid DNA-binding protein